MKGHIYKFNPKSDWSEERIKATDAYALMCKLERGEKPSINELDILFSEFWHPDAYRSGVVRIMGWMLDFSPYFKRYVFRCRWEGWKEVVAYNKTALRKLSSSPSLIAEIIVILVKRR